MRLNLNIIFWGGLFVVLTPAARAQSGATVAPPDRAQAVETARRLTHLLDYVGRDYAGAVSNGKILKAEEYAEQREMVSHLEQLAASLPQLAGDAAFSAELRGLRGAVEGKADAAVVAGRCKTMRERLIESLAIATYPVRPPDLAAGGNYFAANCAPCHGNGGKGDGPSAASLNPKPSDLTGPRMAGLSPYQVANTIRFGVNGTGMAAHSRETDAQVWNAAFFVTALAHPDAPAPATRSGPASAVPFTLRELASSSDRDLQARHPGAAPALLDWARHHPPASGGDVDDFGIARALLDQSLGRYARGDKDGARQDALDSYLEGVEPLEGRLRSRHPSYVLEVEGRLAGLRTLMAQSAPTAKISAEGESARRLLERGDELLSDNELSPFWLLVSASAILLREGLEAVLVVVMLLGLAAGTGARKIRGATHAGWAGALLLGVVTWGISRWLMKFSGASREVIEGMTSLLAVAVLLYVGFWLHSKSELGRWHSFLKESTAGRGIGFWGAFGAAFLAVYREAFETVLFFQTLWLDAGSDRHRWLVAGIALGAVTVGVFAWLLLVLEKKLPLRQFFSLSAITMLVLSVILAGKGLHSLQQSGWIPQTIILGRIPSIFRSVMNFFGIYPSVQTLLLQGVTAILSFSLWRWSGGSNTGRANEAA